MFLKTTTFSLFPILFLITVVGNTLVSEGKIIEVNRINKTPQENANVTIVLRACFFKNIKSPKTEPIAVGIKSSERYLN